MAIGYWCLALPEPSEPIPFGTPKYWRNVNAANDVNPGRSIASVMAQEVVARLRAASLIAHPAELGRARENIIREFLAKLCPRGFTLGTGFVFDASSDVSRQQDIIVARESYHPVFEIGGVKYWPVESVVACIEVKSNLGSTKVVHDALDALRSARALDRTAAGRNYVVTGHVRGEYVERDRHEHQIFTSVVAADSLTSQSLLAAVYEWCQLNDRLLWPNVISVAEKFSVAYLGTDPRPAGDQFAAKGIGIIDNAVEPLLEITRQLLSFLRVVPVVDYDPNNYIPQTMTVLSRKLFDDEVRLPGKEQLSQP